MVYDVEGGSWSGVNRGRVSSVVSMSIGTCSPIQVWGSAVNRAVAEHETIWWVELEKHICLVLLN